MIWFVNVLFKRANIRIFSENGKLYGFVFSVLAIFSAARGFRPAKSASRSLASLSRSPLSPPLRGPLSPPLRRPFVGPSRAPTLLRPPLLGPRGKRTMSAALAGTDTSVPNARAGSRETRKSTSRMPQHPVVPRIALPCAGAACRPYGRTRPRIGDSQSVPCLPLRPTYREVTACGGTFPDTATYLPGREPVSGPISSERHPTLRVGQRSAGMKPSGSDRGRRSAPRNVRGRDRLEQVFRDGLAAPENRLTSWPS